MAKSKLPDVQEITKYAGKLFGDIKNSITGICKEYSEARQEGDEAEQKADAGEAKPEAKAEQKEAPKPKADKAEKNEEE